MTFNLINSISDGMVTMEEDNKVNMSNVLSIESEAIAYCFFSEDCRGKMWGAPGPSSTLLCSQIRLLITHMTHFPNLASLWGLLALCSRCSG
jgi:hypothetical protein